MLQITGINGLKAAGGTFAFNTGAYDSVSKVYFLAPGADPGHPQDLLDAPGQPPPRALGAGQRRQLPDAELGPGRRLQRPERPGQPVPAGHAPGPPAAAGRAQRRRAARPPEGHLRPARQPPDLITDFKKPIKEDSQRFLLGIAVEDVKKFQSSLNKIIEIAGAAPAKREFQGTTIYDFKLPEMPNTAATTRSRAATSASRSPRTTPFPRPRSPRCSSRCSRGAAPGLAENAEFLRVAKDLPSLSPARSASPRPTSPPCASYEMNQERGLREGLPAQGQPGAGRTCPRLRSCSTRTSSPTSRSSPSISPRGAASASWTTTACSSPATTSRKSANP